MLNAILDKCTLQSLSKDEYTQLSYYYRLNIPPILWHEVIADLSKFNCDEKSEKEVTTISRKLPITGKKVSAHYIQLFHGSLLGHDIPLTGQIIIDHGQPLINDLGERGVMIEPSSEDNAITRWKTGTFTGHERDFAAQWRQMANSFDLEQAKRKLKLYKICSSKINSLSDLFYTIHDLLVAPKLQTGHLLNALVIFDTPIPLRKNIMRRWNIANKPFEEFSPYAYHCYKAAFAFSIGLQNSLISTKSSNILDLEYMYYIPFCNVFSTRDKFLSDFSPFLMRSDQEFIHGDILKSDLYALAKCSKENTTRQVGTTSPPDLKDSATCAAWDKCFPGHRSRVDILSTMDEEGKKKVHELLLKKIKSFRPM